MGYLEDSQAIKDEILGTSALMQALREHAAGNPGPFIGGGGWNDHHSVGQLSNGLWIATRQSKVKIRVPHEGEAVVTGTYRVRSFDEEIENLEEYCQTAEWRSEYSEEKRVSSFAVGLRYWVDDMWRGLLLIEDFSQCNTVQIRIGQLERGFVPDDPRPIIFDLSSDFKYGQNVVYKSNDIDGIRYMTLDRVITIDTR